MQRPEISPHIALDHFDKYRCCCKVNRPSHQQLVTHAIALTRPINGTWQTQKRWGEAQRAHNRSHLLDVDQIQAEAQRKENRQSGTGLRQNAESAFGTCAGQGLFDKKE